MIEHVRAVRDGSLPIGVDPTIDFAHVRSEQRMIRIEEPWQKVGAFAGEIRPRID